MSQKTKDCCIWRRAIKLEDKRIFEAFEPENFKEDFGRNVYTYLAFKLVRDMRREG